MSSYPPVRDEVARLLSKPRLNAYKAAVSHGRLEPALELYAWNLAIGSAFFESIHYLEVALRNTIDGSLTAWTAATTAGGPVLAPTPWYRSAPSLLSAESQQKVAYAIKCATEKGSRPEVHGRVVAELSFGFWWSLLADSYSRSLWQPCLRSAFPNARRGRLHADLDDVRKLRNRIAHHEPIHHRCLGDDYNKLLATAERISPRLPWWIDTTSRVPAVLAQRP